MVVQRGQQQQVGKSLGASLLVRRFTSNSKSPSGSSSRLKQREKALAELQQREEEALSKFFHEPSQGNEDQTNLHTERERVRERVRVRVRASE